MKTKNENVNTDELEVAGPSPAPIVQGEPMATRAEVDLNVLYEDGPDEMFFFGRRWRRGVAQPVTATDWRLMQARDDCAPHKFSAV